MNGFVRHDVRRSAFTLPEILVVTGVIALLIAVLLPVLSAGLRTGGMAKSQNNMRQIATWMTLYSSDNRDHIVPSQFDYSASAAAGNAIKVRSHTSLGPLQHKGTWTDILWTINGLGKDQVFTTAAPHKYDFDSPDRIVYEEDSDYRDSPFRSAEPNSRDFYTGPNPPDALPFGDSARESGLPGYFAANNFFDETPDAPGDKGNWFVTGQIKVPERSMYAVDSLAGETISYDGPTGFDPYTNDPLLNPNPIEVDFRYNGACLMLFLDGHISPEGPWDSLVDLEGCVAPGGAITQGRGIRVRNLTSKGLPPCP